MFAIDAITDLTQKSALNFGSAIQLVAAAGRRLLGPRRNLLVRLVAPGIDPGGLRLQFIGKIAQLAPRKLVSRNRRQFAALSRANAEML